MLDNNETESEYIGWALRSENSPYNDRRLEVTGWETISNGARMKKIMIKALNMWMPRFHVAAPIIYASSINGNQTFSIVSKIFNDHVKKKLLHYIYIYCEIFYLFQEDLGAPLSKNNIVFGILVKLPEESESPAVFVDIFKSCNEINYFIDGGALIHRKALPRKKARFDHLTSRGPKKPSNSFRAPKKRKCETSNSKS